MILEQFEGSLEFLHSFEGHNGKPYWPGDNSGITLDPGCDISRVKKSLFLESYSHLWKEETLLKMYAYMQYRGHNAKAMLYEFTNKFKKQFENKITKEQAREALGILAKPYWEEALERFKGLESAPPYVQNSILSLCYNRGTFNKDLAVLKGPILDRHWRTVGRLIYHMQPNHRLKGVINRRKQEGNHILESLNADSKFVPIMDKEKMSSNKIDIAFGTETRLLTASREFGCTDFEIRFVDLMLNDPNKDPIESFRKLAPEYGEVLAKYHAEALLSKPEVQFYVEHQLLKSDRETSIKKENILDELKYLIHQSIKGPLIMDQNGTIIDRKPPDFVAAERALKLAIDFISKGDEEKESSLTRFKKIASGMDIEDATNSYRSALEEGK